MLLAFSVRHQFQWIDLGGLMKIRVRLMQKILALLIPFLLIAGGRVFAQAGRGSINGTVTDPSGAVVPKAQVVLLNQATGVTEHRVTNSAGFYTFLSLNPGEYRVTASGSGFASTARDNVVVTVDQTTLVNIALQIGAASEVVTVKAGVSLVEPTNSTVGELIPAEAIDRVPLVYRNVYDLVQLSAGVNAVNGSPNSSDNMQSIQNISSGRPGVDVSADTINGAIDGSVYYMVDGSPIGIAENNSAAIIPAMSIPEDAVEEVRVETQDTPASFQSGSAGVISLATKSGTNSIHGDVFGVFRPDWLAANDYFNKQSEIANGQANTPPAFHRYQEGGAIGGPIKKDKLFFFGDYEDTQEAQFQGLQTYSVPTSAERTGNFSALLNNTSSGAPAPVVIYDPTKPDYTAANAPNPSLIGTRQPFPGNIIPNPNPIGLLYLSMMPKCNFPNPATCDSATSDVSPNFAVPGLDPLNAHKFDVRVDWAASETQHIFTRFSYDRLDFSSANVFPSGWDPDYAQNVTNGRNALVGDDLTFNSTTFLQLRYSFTRHYENQGGPPSYSSTNLTDLGTVNGSTVGFPASLAAQEIIKQLPFIVFGDLSGSSSGNSAVGGTADFNIFQYASENSDANATLTKVLSKHELSFGFEWMKRYLNVGQPPAPAGAYEFDISATDQCNACAIGGSDFASLLVGMASDPNGAEPEVNFYPNFTQDVFAAESDPYYASFIQDTYHPWKSLTVTAGLRWDIFGGRNERFNRQEYFDPTATNTVDGDAYTGAEIYANGSNRSPYTTNLRNFGPRLAFAWQPVTNFVVRAGAGIYYGPSTENVASALVNTDGFSSQTTWNGTCANSDGNTVFNGTSCGVNTGSATDVFTGPYSLSNPFPTGVVPILTSSPSGLANNLGITLHTVLHSQPTPTTYNYNLGLEYQLPHQIVVSAAYVGSRGLYLPLGTVDLNQLDLATIAKFNNSLCISNLPSCSTAPNPYAALPGAFNGQATVPPWFVLQEYPQFGDGSYGLGNGVIVSGYPGGDSQYNSLQAKVQKRLTNHFTLLSTFTWGKLMTDDGNPPLDFVGSHNGSAQDWRDLQDEWSVSPQDLSYSYSGEASYDLPIGKGRALDLKGAPNDLLGGWTINGVLYLSSGVPINAPSSGTSPSYFNQRADMVCNPADGAPHTAAAWFNVNCFVQPGTENGGAPNPFIPGNAPDYLSNLRTRGARELDLSVFKTVKITETKELRFDVSCYNASNYAQWGYPNVTDVVTAAEPGQNFGQITSDVNTPRQFQFGARFTF
jgi:hypothetical protein